MNHGNCNANMQMDDVAWLSLEECNNTPGLIPQSYFLLKIIIIVAVHSDNIAVHIDISCEV